MYCERSSVNYPGFQILAIVYKPQAIERKNVQDVEMIFFVAISIHTTFVWFSWRKKAICITNHGQWFHFNSFVFMIRFICSECWTLIEFMSASQSQAWKKEKLFVYLSPLSLNCFQQSQNLEK